MSLDEEDEAAEGGNPALLPVYIVIAALFVVGVVIAAFVLMSQFGDRLRCCCMKKAASSGERNNNVVSISQQQQQPSAAATPADGTGAAGRTYALLEDHLHLVDSPLSTVGMITADNNFSSRPKTVLMRGRTAAATRASVIERMKGVTLEFMAEENTLLQIEAVGDKVTKITKTKIVIEHKIRQNQYFSLHKGRLDDLPISVYIIGLGESAFESARSDIVERDRQREQPSSRLTPHPRFVRYLGTCFNKGKREAYVITDFVAGTSLQEMWKNPEVRDVMDLTEEERICASLDLADSVYFLHGHTKPVIHGGICLSSVVIDGETHRGKLVAKEAIDTIDKIIALKSSSAESDTAAGADRYTQEKSPQLIRDSDARPDAASDVWSLGATVLEFLFDQSVWDLHSLTKQFSTESPHEALKLAIEAWTEPSILSTVNSANPKLKFLTECLMPNPQERPTATYVEKGLQQCLTEIRKDSKRKASFLFPDRRFTSSASSKKPLDPLVKQQVEWNVKQDAGKKRRALMFGTRKYSGRDFESLSVTPVNDVKDMASVLGEGGFGLGSTYENVSSAAYLEDILSTYVEAVNKEPEEIELLLFYFSGHGVQGLPGRLATKRRLGIFLDRVGICHDLALAASDESLCSVAKVQTMLADLNPKVKRIVIVLDIRQDQKSKREQLVTDTLTAESFFSDFRLEGDAEYVSEMDWEVPAVSEEAIGRLTTMFTIYPKVEEIVSLAACDSHPKRTNGFLTGCLLNVLKDYTKPTVEEIPGLVDAEMGMEADKNKAFAGIECKADFIPVDTNLWMMPLLDKH